MEIMKEFIKGETLVGVIRKESTLVKYECLGCEEQFIINQSREKKHEAEGNIISCPFCKSERVQAIVLSDPNGDHDLGCLGIYDYDKNEGILIINESEGERVNY